MSKISDKDRIKIYKRVPLEEAEKQFKTLAWQLQSMPVFRTCPVSRNFRILVDIRSRESAPTKYYFHFVQLGIEIPGSGNDHERPDFDLYRILTYPLEKASGSLSSDVLKSLYIGLSRGSVRWTVPK